MKGAMDLSVRGAPRSGKQARSSDPPAPQGGSTRRTVLLVDFTIRARETVQEFVRRRIAPQSSANECRCKWHVVGADSQGHGASRRNAGIKLF